MKAASSKALLAVAPLELTQPPTVLLPKETPNGSNVDKPATSPGAAFAQP